VRRIKSYVGISKLDGILIFNCGAIVDDLLNGVEIELVLGIIGIETEEAEGIWGIDDTSILIGILARFVDPN